MGRTLHYQVLNQDQLSDEHLEAMLAVSKAYNTGQFANVWTCENFFLDPLASYPNWQAGHDWKSYEKRYGELEAQGASPLAIRGSSSQKASPSAIPTNSAASRRSAAMSGTPSSSTPLCSRSPSSRRHSSSSPTKASFLLCDVLMRKGKVRPDRDSITRSWQYWERQGFLKRDEYGCATKKALQEKLLKKGNRWQQPEALCRPVKPEDFTEHPEYNAGEIMAGFRGEYYGLTDKNPFDESMHAIARIHSLLPEGMTLRFGKKLP